MLGVVVFFISGCAQIQETTKTIWGSSTRALEEARAEALAKSFSCSFDECYAAVLDLGRKDNAKTLAYEGAIKTEQTESEEEKEKAKASPEPGFFDIFIQNPIKRHVVVMGIHGNVDTTEVGIFFTRLKPKVTKIEIASLSSTAKRKVADAVFNALGNLYPEPK